jgi:hypothetical protein
MPSIKSDRVIDSWATVVKSGAGKDGWVMRTTEQNIKDANPPHVECQRTDVSTGIFGAKRDFLMVTHGGLREYALYIGARDFGRDLDVSWFLTLSPGFLKRQISKYATGNPQALSMAVNLFDQQDLRAFTTIAHHSLQDALKMLLEDLKQDYSTINRKSKGFLEVW